MPAVPQMTQVPTTFKGPDGKMTTSTAFKWIKSDASYFTAMPTITTANGKPMSTTKTAYAEIITPTATANGKPTEDKTLVIAPVIGEALKKTYEQAGSGCLAGKRQACLLLGEGVEAELVDILKHYAIQLTKVAATDEVIGGAAALVLIKGSLDAARNITKTKGANYDSIGSQLSYPVSTETKNCPTTELTCDDVKCNGKDKKCTEVRYLPHESNIAGGANALKPATQDCACTEPKYVPPHILGVNKKWLNDQQRILSAYLAAPTSAPQPEPKCVNGDIKTAPTVNRDIATKNAETFCSKQREDKTVVNPLKGVNENYQKGTNNDVDFSIHWSLACQQGKDVNVDYDECKQLMGVVIDGCDTHTPDGSKTGGTAISDCLVYGMKPNPAPKAAPPAPPPPPPPPPSEVKSCNKDSSVKRCQGQTIDVDPGTAHSAISEFCRKHKDTKLNPADKVLDSDDKPNPPSGSPFDNPVMWYHISAGWQPPQSNGVPVCPNARQIDIGHPTADSDCEKVLREAFDQCMGPPSVEITR